MNIPDHYRALYRTWLRYAIVMILLGLLIGLSFEESAKRAPVSAVLPAGVHLEAILPLALAHGHAILLGTVLPLVLVFMLHLGLTLGFRPRREDAEDCHLALPAGLRAFRGAPSLQRLPLGAGRALRPHGLRHLERRLLRRQ